MDLRRGRPAQGPRLTLKVHAAVASARKSVLGHMAPHPGLEPCLPLRPNSGLIFSLHGIQTCTKQRREHTRPIFLQGDGFFLTPGCPSVFRCQEPSLGRCWGSSLCRSLTPSGASARPCRVHPAAGLLGCFCCDAQKWQGPCCTGLWGSPLVSLSLSDPLPCGQWEILGDSS